MLQAKRLTFVLVTLVGLGLSAGAAHAGDYAALTIRNPSSTTIHYQIKWGDGDWKSVHLDGHTERHHWIEVDEDGLHEIPHVRFDYLGGNGSYDEKGYRLHCYETDYPRGGGRKYTFKYVTRSYLDLFEGY